MTTRPNIEELDRLWEEWKSGCVIGSHTALHDALHNAYPELSAYVKALERAHDMALIALLGLDARCRKNGIDPGPYYDRAMAEYEMVRGKVAEPPKETP